MYTPGRTDGRRNQWKATTEVGCIARILLQTLILCEEPGEEPDMNMSKDVIND